VRQLRPAAEAPPPVAEVTPAEAAPPAPAEVPDWLQEITPSEAPPPVVEAVPREAAPPPAPAEIPDWLQEIAPAEAPPPAPGVAPYVPPLMEYPEDAGLAEAADWLAELEAEPFVAPSPAGADLEGLPPAPPPLSEAEAPEAGAPQRGEIPDWMLAMRPRDEGPAATVEEEPLETYGLLKGLRGVISPTHTAEIRAVPATAPAVSDVSLSRAQLLQSLLAQPTEAIQPEAVKRGPRMGEQIQRWLVALVLMALAALIVLTAPQVSMLPMPSLTQPVDSPAVRGLFNAVEKVSASDTILVAFEYGPTEADELDLVAQPILGHLLDQGANLSIVATQPEALATADELLRRMGVPEQERPQQRYRPGNTSGISQLLADVDASPNLVVVLTAEPGQLRGWIEQTHTTSRGQVPIVAGVSAALEPTASVYLDPNAGQLGGAVVGLRGAASYEMLLGSGGPAAQRLDALTLGHLAAIALMIIGAIVHALGGARRREK
jgi:hypothetical protein